MWQAIRPSDFPGHKTKNRPEAIETEGPAVGAQAGRDIRRHKTKNRPEAIETISAGLFPLALLPRHKTKNRPEAIETEVKYSLAAFTIGTVTKQRIALRRLKPCSSCRNNSFKAYCHKTKNRPEAIETVAVFVGSIGFLPRVTKQRIALRRLKRLRSNRRAL